MIVEWLVVALAATQDGDKIGKEKAPVIVKKSLAEISKKKGYHFVQKSAVTGPQSQESNFDGVAKKDFAAAKGTAEVYAKAGAYLVNVDGKFYAPEQLQGTTALQAGSFRNPALFLGDLARLEATSKWGDEADVDGHACKTVELTADEATLKQQVKEFADKLKDQLKQVGNITGYIDTKKSTSKYKVYIGKADLLIYKLEWDLKPVVKENSIPPNLPVPKLDKLEAKSELTFSKYDEDLDVAVPKEVQQRLGVK